MYKKVKQIVSSCMVGAMLVTSGLSQGVMTTYANEVSGIASDDMLRAEIEASLYDFEYYCMANEDVLSINTDVAKVVGKDYAAATNHFLTSGIYEGRSGSREFDYTVYKYCNKDVVKEFGDDIVGYYFHYVNYGRAENRTATLVSSKPTVT